MDNVLALLTNNLPIIISFVLGLGIIAPFLLTAKAKIKALHELVEDIDEALEDNKLSKEEIGDIIADAKALCGL